MPQRYENEKRFCMALSKHPFFPSMGACSRNERNIHCIQRFLSLFSGTYPPQGAAKGRLGDPQQQQQQQGLSKTGGLLIVNYGSQDSQNQ